MTALSVPVLAAAPPDRADVAARGRRLVERYFRLTPLLWLSGFLAPAGVLTLATLAWRRWPRGVVINAIVGLWLAVGAAQAFASFVNAWLVGDVVAGTLRNLVSLGVLGWLFAGLGIAIGYTYGLTHQRMVRSVAMLGLYVLIFGSLALLASRSGASSMIFKAPLGQMLPDSPVATFYFSVALYSTEDSFGDNATRLILFFPWPTALAMGGIAIGAISLRDRSLLWRLVGLAGGAMGVVFSWSRIGLAAFAIVLAAEAFLALGRLARSLLVALALLGLFGLLVGGFDPVERLAHSREAVDAARSGSSEARALIYEKSWEGFLRSPLVGYGWIGPSVHPKENLPIGSHSTLYGLAYTGGAPTIGAFLLALGATLLASGRAALGSDPTRSGRTAFLLALTLLVFSPYEELFSFSLPCLFLFAWIGGALREAFPTAPVHADPRPQTWHSGPQAP